MSVTASTCCVVVINQQQQQNIYHQKQCADTPVNPGKSTSKNCTVVENGRVVVKPSESRPNQGS